MTEMMTVMLPWASAGMLLSVASGTPGNHRPIAQPSFGLGTTTVTTTTTDKAGNSTSSSVTFTVRVTFDSLCPLLGLLDRRGSRPRSCGKLATAKAAALAGNVKAKNNALDAYRSQGSAQSGKALTKEQALRLTVLSKGL